MSIIDRRRFLASAGMAPALVGWKPARQPERSYDVPAAIHRYRKLDSDNHIFSDPGVVIAATYRLEIEKVAISAPIADPKQEAHAGRFPRFQRPGTQSDERLSRPLSRAMLPQSPLPARIARGNRPLPRRRNDRLGRTLYASAHQQSAILPIIEKCIEFKAPLMCHGGQNRKDFREPDRPGASRAEDFVEAAHRYPEAMLIYGHIGGGGDWEYACKALRGAPTVFADTSGSVTDEGMVDFAVKCLGVRRLLFATDMNFETGVGKILAAQLTEEERRQMFFDNFNEILRKIQPCALISTLYRPLAFPAVARKHCGGLGCLHGAFRHRPCGGREYQRCVLQKHPAGQ